MSIMRKLVVWVALVLVAVVAFEALDVSDADARKRRRPPSPPAYNVVACDANTVCNGTLGADVMVGAAGDEELRGVAGNDIYVGSAGFNDKYTDLSTSNDLYGGFRNDEFDNEAIADQGGVDRVDLASTSAYSSTDFEFVKGDFDSDGVQDDLNMSEKNGSDDIYVFDHFGTGRIDQVKFTDKTLSGSNLPLTP
jgi:hypothetical protein